MNWNEVARNWNEARVDIRSRWTKLTDDDLRTIDGNEDRLVAKLEERHSLLEDRALAEVNEWLEKRSPPAELRPYRATILAGIAMGVVLAGLTFVPLPWGPVKYVVAASLCLALMAMVFFRRPRLEF